MFNSPTTHTNIDSFKFYLDQYLTGWRGFLSIRRKMFIDEVREGTDLMHLLLSYNLSGLPGFVQGVEIPGTDIHSLPNRDKVMGRYFPFAIKQGIVNKFLSRERRFAKIVTLSMFHGEPVFLIFVDLKDEKKLILYENKVREICNWLKIVLGKQFYYQFIDVNKGTPIANSSPYEYPVFRKDVFLFFLMMDFLPLGIPYFFYKREGLKLNEVDSSWARTLSQISYENSFYTTDIFGRLPMNLNESFLKFFIDWVFAKGTNTLMETLVYTFIIKIETFKKGSVFTFIDENFSNLELFFHPSIFFYIMFREKVSDNEIMSVTDRAFYITLRQKKRFIFAGIEKILNLERFSFLSDYLEEPQYYSVREYRKIIVDEQIIRDTLLEYTNQLRKVNEKIANLYARKIESKYNLHLKYIKKLTYPINFSYIDYASIVIIHREGVENEWELQITSDDHTKETVYRCNSIEEIFLFSIVNGIEWKKGVILKNIGAHIRTKAEKLWSSIDSWLKNDEKVFIGINYFAKENKDQDNYYFLSSVEDILNMGEENRSLVNELSVFLKNREYSQISTFAFKGINNISHLLSTVIDNIGEYEDNYRISLCYDIMYRPILDKIEKILKKDAKSPFIMRENGNFNLITFTEVRSFPTFQQLLHESRRIGFTGFNMDPTSKGIQPYVTMTRYKTFDKTQIFFLGTEFKEIVVFYNGLFVDGYIIKKKESAKDYLISIFTFINSLAVFTKKEIEFDILAYKQKDNGEGFFQDVKSNIEYESLSQKKSSTGFGIDSEKNYNLKVGRVKYDATRIKDLIYDVSFNNQEAKKVLIDYCNSFPFGKYTPLHMLKLKFFIEKKLK